MNTVIVHGGAGDLSRAAHPLSAYKKGVEKAAAAGYNALQKGNALDAVVAAVCALEDDPLFNAGTGAVLNVAGEVEADAMVMFQGAIGAVGALTNMKNPVKVAQLVMEKTDHLFLVGEGAYHFARKHFDDYNPVTKERKAKFEELKAKFLKGDTRWKKNVALYTEHGTVGAVAYDGTLAAATSTGGIWLKMKGRIGDSPMVGCGTFAGEYAALSATGMGENIMKSVFAKSVHDATPQYGFKKALETFLQHSPETGAVGIDAHGNAAYAYNTNHLLWALCDQKGITSFEVGT